MSDKELTAEESRIIAADPEDPSTWPHSLAGSLHLMWHRRPAWRCLYDDDDMRCELVECAVTRACAGHSAKVDALLDCLDSRVPAGSEMARLLNELRDAVGDQELALMRQTVLIWERSKALLPIASIEELLCRLAVPAESERASKAEDAGPQNA